jgi:hypothetical protein
MAQSQLGRANRFYSNPVLRDAEWNQATKAPWWLIVLVVAVVAAGFFAGVYADGPSRVVGWTVGIVAIVVFFILAQLRRRRARRELRRAHGQAVS